MIIGVLKEIKTEENRVAMIPAGVTIAWFGLRTILEDKTLRQELEGYDEYARRVRYKWIPFIW